MELIVEALDNYKTEEGNLAYLQRQIAREKAKADAYVAKRKEENATRTAAGLAPLPEEDVSRLFKIHRSRAGWRACCCSGGSMRTGRAWRRRRARDW